MNRTQKKRSARRVQQVLDFVRHLDQRILSAGDAGVNEAQQARVLEWAHRHLMTPVILQQDRALAGPMPTVEMTMEKMRYSLYCIKLIDLMLGGAIGFDANLEFRCLRPPPEDWRFEIAGIASEDASGPDTVSVAGPLVDGFHRRLVHGAQRTRVHNEEEIRAMLAWADAELILYACAWFSLRRHLGVAQQWLDLHEATIMALSMVAREFVSIEWTSYGALFAALKTPSGGPLM